MVGIDGRTRQSSSEIDVCVQVSGQGKCCCDVNGRVLKRSTMSFIQRWPIISKKEMPSRMDFVISTRVHYTFHVH